MKYIIDCYNHDGKLIVTKTVYGEAAAQDVRNHWFRCAPNGHSKVR